MNKLVMIVFTLLAFTWYGGQHVPKVLKDNKQILLGVAVGLVLNMFMVEGFDSIVGDLRSPWAREPVSSPQHVHDARDEDRARTGIHQD